MWNGLVQMIAIVLAHYINGIFTMPCSSSLLSMQNVSRCPRNSLEWDARADFFNCSSINHTCGTADMFLYHCVLNADGTKLLEVCAPYKFIHGQKCTEFDAEGPIIQENSNSCSNAPVPCPVVYISTVAYKYQSCYDRVQMKANDVTTNKPTDIKNDNIVTTTTIVTYSTLTVINLLLLGIFIVWKRKKMRSHEHYIDSHKVLIRLKKSEGINETGVSADPSTSHYLADKHNLIINLDSKNY